MDRTETIDTQSLTWQVSKHVWQREGRGVRLLAYCRCGLISYVSMRVRMKGIAFVASYGALYRRVKAQ